MKVALAMVVTAAGLAASLVSERAGASEVGSAPSVGPYVEAEVGAGYVDALALKGGALIDPERAKSSGFGAAFGVALGVRLKDVRVAARYRQVDLSDFQLVTLGGEVGLSLAVGRICPRFALGAGYAKIDGLVADISRSAYPGPAPEVDIWGLDLRVMAGADYYVKSWFSVGATLSADALFLRRRGDHLPRTFGTDPNVPPEFRYGTDGSANGLGATLSLALGLHY